MRKILKALHQERETHVQKMDELLAKADEEDRELNEDEQKEFGAASALIGKLNARIELEKKVLDEQDRFKGGPDPNTIAENQAAKPEAEITIPGYRGNLACFKEPKSAFRFGMWLMAIAGKSGPQKFCNDHSIKLQWLQPKGDEQNIGIDATYTEGSNTAGGYLVLPEFDRDIIELVEFYGRARQVLRVVPMASETKQRDRRSGGLTAYFVGEGDAGTESTGSWNQVELIAKKLMVLTRVSSELNADSIINMADNIAKEVARAFAKKEDDCAFIGTGTSTYGGIKGIATRLTDINGVDDGGGLVLGAGNLMSEITLANLHDCIGAVPEYADDADTGARWICHKVFFSAVMQRLLAAAGGNTIETLQTGARQKVCLGYPVLSSNCLPKTDGNSQVLALFGDYSLCGDFGDRQQMTMALSDSASVGGQSVFERDQLAFRATERIDINIHDLGDATNAGPVVGLISAAS